MPRSRAGRAAALGGVLGAETAKRAARKATDLVRTDTAAEKSRDTLFAEQLVTVLGSMRGLAMKVGQLLSLIDPGILTPEQRELFQSALAKLQDDGPCVPWERMRGRLETALGGAVTAVFAEFDTEPVAAASIGQVYRARLTDGRAVAVKVQYPGIAAAVTADLKNLRTLLSAYRFLRPELDTGALADELAARMTEELDYRIEARNTAYLAERYAGHPFIRIPEVVAELSGQHVIVTEWLAGQPLRSAYTASTAERNRLAEILFRFYGATPYLLGQYNADPHPGNVVLLDDGSVGFLDFGLCKTVDAATAAAELAALRAGIDGDVDRVVELMETRGFARRADVGPAAAFAVFLQVFGWYLRDEEAAITPEIANDLVGLFGAKSGVSLRPFNLPAAHALRGRAELQLAAVLGQLRPRLNLHRIAREWIFGDEPVTELGRAHRAWQDAARHRERATEKHID